MPKNPILEELQRIVNEAPKHHIYSNRRTYALDDPELPLHVVARFVQDRVNEVVEKHAEPPVQGS